MTTALPVEVDGVSDVSVITAVGFLDDVLKKHWNEDALRKYLIEKRGLSEAQVQEAFRIHHLRSNEVKGDGTMADTEEGYKERPERQLVKPEEATHETDYNTTIRNISFLLFDKKKAGEKLIDDFLISEKGYCLVLECLTEDYQRELTTQARQGRIDMIRDEVDEIFSYIPKLLKFHRTFHTELLAGTNIGRLFIRRLSFFKGYGEYIKDLTSNIEILRKYIFDKKLQKCLGQVRRRSRLTKNDLTDLLLTPLDRILDYQIFLDTLYEWADQTQIVQYDFFAKAARRIGRIANYIEKYRHGVINRCEMSRIQRYLGKQCSIIQNSRSIVRRGIMKRRTTGWASRNKKYHFFLFNDVLIWTTKTGILKNVVELKFCKVSHSDSRSFPERKFKILINKSGKGLKTVKKCLLLECDSEQQKESWYNALVKVMQVAKKEVSKTESVVEELEPTLEVFSTMENDSDEDTEDVKNNTWSEDTDNAVQKHRLSEDWGTSDVSVDAAYHDRFDSHNFIQQRFQDFGQMDDTESQLSEYDHSFFEKFGTYHDQTSTSCLSPHRKSIPLMFDDEKASGVITKDESGALMRGKIYSTRRCVIVRKAEPTTSKSVSNSENGKDQEPSFSLRLSDRQLMQDPNFTISLSSLDGCND